MSDVCQPAADNRHDDSGTVNNQPPPNDDPRDGDAFGAPFGIERENRSAMALVAIRNVQWNGDRVRVGSGAGLLPESQLEREFEELRQKRDQVKALFGIESEAWTASNARRA